MRRTRATNAIRKAKGIKAAKISAAIGICCLFAVSCLHQGYAYFSATSEMKVNQLSIVKGEQDQEDGLVIIEPEWDLARDTDGNYAMDLQPGESVVKDPQVESHVDYPCWVFVEVSIPEGLGVLEKNNNPYPYVTFTGDKTEYEYSYEIVVPEINEEDWKIYQRSDGKNLISYVYGCKTPLEAHEVTSPVFTSITVPEFNQFEGGENYIFVRAKAVQTEGCPTLDEAAEKLGIKQDIDWTAISP